MKIFLDANVLFSASNVGSGIHRLVLYLAKHYEVISSDYAEAEAQRNVQAKREQWLPGYTMIIGQVRVVASVDRALAVEIADKDRPIIATAIREQCEYLVTGDRRDFGHLFDQEISGVCIVTPQRMAEIVAKIK